jgi:hypothetical protein
MDMVVEMTTTDTKTKEEVNAEPDLSTLSEEDRNLYIQYYAQRDAEIAAGVNVQRPKLSQIPIDPSTQVPVFGRFIAYLFTKYDIENPDELIDEIYVIPREIAEAVGEWNILYNTSFDDIELPGWFLWTVIRGEAFDAKRKRPVPIKQVVMTPRLAIYGVDVAKQLQMLSHEELEALIEQAEGYENVSLAVDAHLAKREAATAWDAFKRSQVSHTKSTQEMYEVTKDADDAGDDAYSKSVRGVRGSWDWILDNKWIIIGVVLLFLYYAYTQGWFGT